MHLTYDPTATDESAIQHTLTEPYYDALADTWRILPYQIAGYDPLAQSPPDEQFRP